MFHMLTCMDLKPGVTVDEFAGALADLDRHMRQEELLVSTGAIGRRQRHPVMDTDDERDHEYYFIMSFRDRAQCDLAVEEIRSQQEPGKSIHEAVYRMIEEPVFICWEDIASSADSRRQ